MISLGNLVVYLFLIGICVYTSSYGTWTWKKKNKLGAIMLFVLALSVICLPIYVVYFRD